MPSQEAGTGASKEPACVDPEATRETLGTLANSEQTRMGNTAFPMTNRPGNAGVADPGICLSPGFNAAPRGKNCSQASPPRPAPFPGTNGNDAGGGTRGPDGMAYARPRDRGQDRESLVSRPTRNGRHKEG